MSSLPDDALLRFDNVVPSPRRRGAAAVERTRGYFRYDHRPCPGASLMLRFFLLLSTVVLAASAAPTGAAQAQSGWPDRPIRVIVPFPAGSSSDVAARILGNELSARLGQQLVVENRPGASGNIGSDVIAKSPPDGYTLGFATTTTHAVAVGLSPSPPHA